MYHSIFLIISYKGGTGIEWVMLLTPVCRAPSLLLSQEYNVNVVNECVSVIIGGESSWMEESDEFTDEIYYSVLRVEACDTICIYICKQHAFCPMS